MRGVILLIFFFISANIQAKNYYIAHRGASYLAPENTLAAVNLAWKIGADAVEVDVHLSADNRVMVIHDANTNKTSGKKVMLKVDETNSDELRKIDVGSFKSDVYKGEKIPFLEEVIATVPFGKQLVVEVKCGSEIVPYLKEIVENSGKADQIIFISFGWDTILKIRDIFPYHKCYYLKSMGLGLPQRMEMALGEKLQGVNLRHKIIDHKVMDKAYELGIEVLAWTVDDPDEVKRLNELGVTKITTNRPQWLKEQMNE